MENKKRLIDANALENFLANNYGYPVVDILGDIAEFPTVDAVEVLHGRWECVYDEDRGETDVTCSHCKDTRTINGCYVTSNGEPCYFEDNYCPNCGAKMDGDGNA